MGASYGSVSVRTLRLEASRGRLVIERIGNKDFPTLAAIEAMRELCRVPPQPPRLYLRERKGQEARYVILDRGREIGTGFGESDQRSAEEAFGRYLADKHRPDFVDGHPSRVAVADALTYYLESLRDNFRSGALSCRPSQRSGFESAKQRADLGVDVTPHTLKHTYIIWLLQKGFPTWQVAGFTGTSEGLITRVNGHHSPNDMKEARSAIGRR